jgi:oligoribonuclease NrnB/cAMP/cGMP phosphodiesterase (DHH superfamily)
VTFHPGVYGEDPPDVTGQHVMLVDFSYKRPVLERMAQQAASVTIIDHHQSAQADLEGLDGVSAFFDMHRSGAGLTWDIFFPGQPRPALIDHVEDRDLWRFKLPKTREIQAAVFSYPYEFEVWDRLMEANLDDLAAEGAAIERKHQKDVAELIGKATRRMTIAGHTVPVANLPYVYASDAGHLLAQGEPFAGCYYDTPTGRVFSLRSHEDGMDVSKIAAQYGGGGHKHAAGFRVGYQHELACWDEREGNP